jgi:hypothetical protein
MEGAARCVLGVVTKSLSFALNSLQEKIDPENIDPTGGREEISSTRETCIFLQRIASPGIDPTLYDLPRFIYMMMMK